MSKFYITTPIYYVNDQPHIGSAYTTIAADVLARWHGLIGDKTFFLTGTDEHGAKIEAKAIEAGLEPLAFVDEVSTKFKTAWQDLNISFDNFIRTTDSAHIKAVQNGLQFMFDKGDIYIGKYEGLYCRGCEQYKSGHDLTGGKCPDHDAVPEKMSEDCYMFKLSKYQDVLLEKIKSDELKINPLERKNEVVSFFEKEGLNDIAFSRKNVKWGVPLPWDESQTAYVWADAFLNYLTGLGWEGITPPTPPSQGGENQLIPSQRGENQSSPSQAGENISPLMKGELRGVEFWPTNLHLMSKDILRVHATIWPAMLLSLGLGLPKEIFVHGFFTIDGKKMSKSLGNVIRPDDMIKKYGVDATRYLLMSAAVFGHDGDVSWEKFDEKFNADLANGLGNLVSRVSNLLEKNNIELELSPDAENIFFDDYKSLMENLKLDEALKYLWIKLKSLDEELSAKTPWKIKDADEVKNILAPMAQKVLHIAGLLSPFMPSISEKIINQFTQKQVVKSESLFPRI